MTYIKEHTRKLKSGRIARVRSHPRKKKKLNLTETDKTNILDALAMTSETHENLGYKKAASSFDKTASKLWNIWEWGKKK